MPYYIQVTVTCHTASGLSVPSLVMVDSRTEQWRDIVTGGGTVGGRGPRRRGAATPIGAQVISNMITLISPALVNARYKI